MPEQFPGECAGAVAILEGDFSVDDDGMIAFCPLDATPFTTRKVVDNLTDPIRLDP